MCLTTVCLYSYTHMKFEFLCCPLFLYLIFRKNKGKWKILKNSTSYQNIIFYRSTNFSIFRNIYHLVFIYIYIHFCYCLNEMKFLKICNCCIFKNQSLTIILSVFHSLCTQRSKLQLSKKCKLCEKLICSHISS